MPPKFMNDSLLMNGRLFCVDENGAEHELPYKETGFHEVEFLEMTSSFEKFSEDIRRLSKSFECSFSAITVFGNVERQYLHKNMSNNWLKIHGFPMRRRQWKQ